MPTEDLKSRTPGPLDDASRRFVERVRDRGQPDAGGDTPDAIADNTGVGEELPGDALLPLDDRGSDDGLDQASRDVDGGDPQAPDANNPNDLGEDEPDGTL